MSEYPESNVREDVPDESPPPRKPRRRGPVLILILIGGLATVYLFNPTARNYAISAISGFINSGLERSNPEPAHDVDLIIHAIRNFREKNWAEARSAYEQLILQDPENDGFRNKLASTCHNLQDYEAAIEINKKLVEAPFFARRALYNLTREYALTDQKDKAFNALHQAVRYGFRQFDYMNSDPDLESLRADERYRFPPGPEFHEFTCEDGTVIEYALVLPLNFDETKTYPALLGLSGDTQNRDSTNYGLNNFWGMQGVYHEWIVIAPSAPKGKRYYYGDGYRYIPELLENVASRFRLEGGKFHIAGLSNGGISAFRIATSFPERFRSFTVFPGYAEPGDVFKELHNLKGMTITLYYGEKEIGFFKPESIRTHEELKRLGIPSTLKVFPGEPHIPWSLLGDALMTSLDTKRDRSPAIAASPGSR